MSANLNKRLENLEAVQIKNTAILIVDSLSDKQIENELARMRAAGRM